MCVCVCVCVYDSSNTFSDVTDLVTETDTRVELLVIDYLKKHGDASFQFLTEETQNDEQNLTNEPTWVIG